METTGREIPPAAPRRLWLVALLGAIALALLVIGLAERSSPRRELAEMAPAERAELYRTTLSAFRAECVDRKPVSVERCASDAAFLLLFPECTEACRQSAEAFFPRPSK